MAPPNLVNSPKLREMTISKPTFTPSTPCTLHFEFLESGPNDSTRVRRLTGILRRARVKIFILAYVSFWLRLSGFSGNLTGVSILVARCSLDSEENSVENLYNYESGLIFRKIVSIPSITV